MTTNYTITGASLEDAIRQLIDEAAGGDVDIHLRTRGFDPRSTGPTTLRVEMEDAAEVHDDDSDDSEGSDDSDDAVPAAAPASAPRSRGGASVASDEDDEVSVEELEEEADAAADFMEGLLDAMQLPGDLKIRILDAGSEVEVVEADSGTLIGRRGQTLEAMQELLRCSLQREFQRRTNVQLDVEGYRARRVEKLLEKADEAIDEVLDTGQEVRLEPMDVFERKAVHALVNEVEGVASRSIGREPGRRVVISEG